VIFSAIIPVIQRDVTCFLAARFEAFPAQFTRVLMRIFGQGGFMGAMLSRPHPSGRKTDRTDSLAGFSI
jgi:hypothetical protein